MNRVKTELIDNLGALDMNHLCMAAEATSIDTHGFNVGLKKWSPPLRHELESYFKGVILIPERKLFVVRLDEVIVGSIQVILPHRSNQVSNFAVHLDNHFVVPWARNINLGYALLMTAENYAIESGFTSIRLSVRENREVAISLYKKCGYIKWGYLEKYEFNGKSMIGGYFYYKDLEGSL